MTAVASDPRPKPVRLAETIRRRIREGRYPDGKLPTVRELTKEFGYAGQTVRDGMGILIAEGVVISAGNRGYFVAGDDQEAPASTTDVSKQLTEMRLQIQALTERVTALEERGDSGSA
jgi:GntR family transcriptional regulator